MEHLHADDESSTALEQHLLANALSHEHADDHRHDDDHHALLTHDDKDADGNDLPPHDHDNAHSFIGHIFGHMPVLFSIVFSFHFPTVSQMTQVDLETRPPFVMQDAPFRPPRTFLI